jgi:NAD(P)H-hydrate epimerase
MIQPFMAQRIANPPAIPARPTSGHKGLFGRVLVVGGQDDMLGAPVLAGSAALRAGSGLVQVAMPRSVLAPALGIMPELIGLGLDRGKGDKSLRAAIEKANVVAIGPGLGQSSDAWRRLKIVYRTKSHIVVDADALNMLAARNRWPADFTATAVLTPHPGEMKRLTHLLRGVAKTVPTDDDGRIELAARAAEAFGQIIVLKGERTVVAEPLPLDTDAQARVYVNRTGDSSLSKAGAGDVLTGLVASLIGQGMLPFDAACAAVHIHGRAGELAGRDLGRRSVVARDVIDAIGSAIAEYEKDYGTFEAGGTPQPAD